MIPRHCRACSRLDLYAGDVTASACEPEAGCVVLLWIQSRLYRDPVHVSSTSEALARFGHALSDPTRTRVLLALREGPAYPADLADRLGVSRQIMSHHLACLRGCGLVVSVPAGRRTSYELTDARIGHALGDLLDLVLVVDPACSCDDEPSSTSLAEAARAVTEVPA